MRRPPPGSPQGHGLQLAEHADPGEGGGSWKRTGGQRLLCASPKGCRASLLGIHQEILKNGRTKKVGKIEARSSVLVGRRRDGSCQ